MKPFLGSLLTLVALLAAAAGLIYSGAVDIAADSPHYAVTYKLMETARERAIARRARDITVPAAVLPGQLAEGAEHYAAMCSGCHLAPGKEDTELRQGLYPKPPNLAEPVNGANIGEGAGRASRARQFWIIKHGIKGSGMPAWGKTHDDASLWAMVAFVQKLPVMSEAEYTALSAGSGERQHGVGHSHSHAVEIPEEEAAEAAPAGHSHEHAEHDHSTSVPAPDEVHRHTAPDLNQDNAGEDLHTHDHEQ